MRYSYCIRLTFRMQLEKKEFYSGYTIYYMSFNYKKYDVNFQKLLRPSYIIFNNRRQTV